MVWLPAHCGKFLDSIEGERLFAAFIFTMFSGLRQDEIVGLNWAEADLDEGVAYVRETGSGNAPKSERSHSSSATRGRVSPTPRT
jgi:integrase